MPRRVTAEEIRAFYKLYAQCQSFAEVARRTGRSASTVARYVKLQNAPKSVRDVYKRQHQGRGYGRAALGLLLARLRAEYGNRDVYLSVVAGNEAAARLYASFGFVRTGEKDVGGEEVYVRRAEEMLPPS